MEQQLFQFLERIEEKLDTILTLVRQLPTGREPSNMPEGYGYDPTADDPKP